MAPASAPRDPASQPGAVDDQAVVVRPRVSPVAAGSGGARRWGGPSRVRARRTGSAGDPARPHLRWTDTEAVRKPVGPSGSAFPTPARRIGIGLVRGKACGRRRRRPQLPGRSDAQMVPRSSVPVVTHRRHHPCRPALEAQPAVPAIAVHFDQRPSRLPGCAERQPVTEGSPLGQAGALSLETTGQLQSTDRRPRAGASPSPHTTRVASICVPPRSLPRTPPLGPGAEPIPARSPKGDPQTVTRHLGT